MLNDAQPADTGFDDGHADERRSADAHAAGALSALAHADRIAMFRLLIRSGPAGTPSSVVAGAVSMSRTRASFHLATLERSGLVHSWRSGREIRYAVDVDRTRALMSFLTFECCDGRPELCGMIAEQAASTGHRCAARPEEEGL